MVTVRTYRSRAARDAAARGIRKLIRDAGHEGPHEKAYTAFGTREERLHGLCVHVAGGSRLERLMNAELEAVQDVSAAELFETGANIVRSKDAVDNKELWTAADGNTGVAVAIDKTLRTAWDELTGETVTDVAELPGTATLARLLLNGEESADPAETLRTWSATAARSRDEVIEVLETATEAVTTEGQRKRGRAGELLARHEDELRQRCAGVRAQVHANESEYSSSKLFDAASDLLDEVEHVLKRMNAD